MMVLQMGRYREQLARHFTASLTTGRSPRGLLFFAALYHDIAKPLSRTTGEDGMLRFWGHDEEGAQVTAERARLLVLSNDEIERLQTIVRMHMRIHFHTNRLIREGKPPSRRAIYRFFRDSEATGVEVCLLALADFRATYGHTLQQGTWAACLDVVRLFLENWFEKPAESIAPPSLVDGDDLMKALSLQPGPHIGKLLEAIHETQAVGEISTREQALDFARARLKELDQPTGTPG
jgi:poly(A) polymerase